jgi:hypothetical protein
MTDKTPQLSHPAPSDYNYAVFTGQEPFAELLATPHVGQKAPDCTLAVLDGERVALSSLWRASHLMLEFGSYT